jgi:pyruvate dehydrogenase E2 component (dihydrolipoamide acetyltransferase)
MIWSSKHALWQRHPKVNSQWKKKQLQSTIMLVLVLLAVDGLVVPVLKFTDAMSLSQIGGSVRDLAGRAKNKNYYQPKWKEVLLPFLT